MLKLSFKTDMGALKLSFIWSDRSPATVRVRPITLNTISADVDSRRDSAEHRGMQGGLRVASMFVVGLLGPGCQAHAVSPSTGESSSGDEDDKPGPAPSTVPTPQPGMTDATPTTTGTSDETSGTSDTGDASTRRRPRPRPPRRPQPRTRPKPAAMACSTRAKPVTRGLQATSTGVYVPRHASRPFATTAWCGARGPRPRASAPQPECPRRPRPGGRASSRPSGRASGRCSRSPARRSGRLAAKRVVPRGPARSRGSARARRRSWRW